MSCVFCLILKSCLAFLLSLSFPSSCDSPVVSLSALPLIVLSCVPSALVLEWSLPPLVYVGSLFLFCLFLVLSLVHDLCWFLFTTPHHSMSCLTLPNLVCKVIFSFPVAFDSKSHLGSTLVLHRIDRSVLHLCDIKKKLPSFF